MIGAKRFFAGVSLLLALPSIASAHGVLVSSSPLADANLVAPPSEIRLKFTERPERRFTRITLLSANGTVPLDSVRFFAGNVAVARIPTTLVSGRYRVRWQTAGADGHPVSGEYAFSIARDPAAAAATPPPDTVSPAESFAAFGAMLRWLTLVGAITAIGAVVFRATVIARVASELDREIATDYLPRAARGAAVVGLLAGSLVAFAAIARLLLQSRVMHGADTMFVPSLLGPMLLDTTWGKAWIIQVAAAGVAIAAFTAIRRARDAAWYVAGVGVVALAVGLALSSHAAVVPRLSALSVIANVVHTVAASGWLGNLLLVVLVGLPLAWRLDRDDRWIVIRDVVHSFSPAALAFGAVAGATGVFMAWTHVGSFPALTGTEYGRVLLLKIGLLSLTALTGAYNWLRVRPTLGDESSARRLRRSATLELGIAGLVLAVTAVLVALPMPKP